MVKNLVLPAIYIRRYFFPLVLLEYQAFLLLGHTLNLL